MASVQGYVESETFRQRYLADCWNHGMAENENLKVIIIDRRVDTADR